MRDVIGGASGRGLLDRVGDHGRHPVDRHEVFGVVEGDADQAEQGRAARRALRDFGQERVAKPKGREQTVVGGCPAGARVAHDDRWTVDGGGVEKAAGRLGRGADEFLCFHLGLLIVIAKRLADVEIVFHDQA